MERLCWKNLGISRHCEICGEPIYRLINIKIPFLTVEKWNCEHEYAIRLVG